MAHNGRRLMQSGDIETVTVSPVTNSTKRITITSALLPALPQPFVRRIDFITNVCLLYICFSQNAQPLIRNNYHNNLSNHAVHQDIYKKSSDNQYLNKYI